MSRLRTVRCLMGALAVVLVATSCGSNELDHGGASGRGEDRDTTTSTSDVPTTTVATNSLEGRLADRVPDGFSQEPDDVGDTGPSDLDKAVRDDLTDGAREALVAEGFVQGYQRLWTNPAGDQIILFLYEFGTPEGAAADQARIREVNEADPIEGLAPFAPAGLDPATTYAVAGSADGSAGAVIDLSKGVFHVQVVASADGGDVAEVQARASDLITAQLERL